MSLVLDCYDLLKEMNEEFNATVIKAPESLKNINGFSIFLAGSIDGGEAVDWQTKLTNALKNENITILNPRRDDWDKNIKEDINDENFNEQVNWELDAQEKADIIIMYFSSESKAPISLLELGLFANTGKMIVFCENGYWKKGNVDIVCEKFDVEQVKSFEELLSNIKKII